MSDNKINQVDPPATTEGTPEWAGNNTLEFKPFR